MNKDNRKNGDMGGDNIITKKGFMIALPSKKNAAPAKSSINFSVPQNSQPAEQEKKQQHDKNKNNKKHGKNNNRNHGFEKKNNQAPEKESNDKRNEQASFDKNFTGNQRNHNQKHQGNNHAKKFDKNNRHQKNRDNKDGRNNSFDKNSQKNQNVQQRQPLSSLSKEIADFEAKKAVEKKAYESSFSQSQVSLEEKYKNAVPLAQQIEMEEKKRKKSSCIC